MPLEYNNVKTPFYSEAERTFDTPMSWTGNGADTLALYFRGVAPPASSTSMTSEWAIPLPANDIVHERDPARFKYMGITADNMQVCRIAPDSS